MGVRPRLLAYQAAGIELGVLNSKYIEVGPVSMNRRIVKLCIGL